MMMMIVEQSVECELAGETEVLGENLRKCPGRRGGKPATNRLSYGTTLYKRYVSR
jgi:hypothetical protein